MLQWYVAVVPPQKELPAKERLKDLGYEVMVPVEYKWRRRSRHTRPRDDRGVRVHARDRGSFGDVGGSMTTRLRHTVVYGIIGLLIAPVMWWLGLLGSEAAAAVAVFAPMAYWTGFRDGERFGEMDGDVANEPRNPNCIR